jgi:hypothetical protein
MAWTYVAGHIETGTTNSPPTGAAADDVLICAAPNTGSGSVLTPPSGWTEVQSDPNPADFGIRVFTRVMQSGDTSWTWSWDVGTQQQTTVAIRGADTTTPVDVSSATQSTAVNTLATASVDPVGTDGMFVGIWSLDAANRTWTQDASLTERIDGDGGTTLSVCVATEVLTSGAALTRSATCSGTAQDVAAYAIVLKLAAGGATSTLGLATETDTALGVTAAKVVTLGQATETDAALGATAAKTMTMGLATETDTALAVTATKAATLGIATETDSALGMTASKVYTLGLATETDEALGMTSGASASFEFSLAAEVDAALGLTAAKVVTLGLATEVDLAVGFTATKSYSLGIATETDSALGLALTKLAPLGLATETSTAFAITAVKAYPLGLAAEVDEALAIVSAGPYTPALLPTATTRAQATATTRDLNGAATTRETA